MLSIKAASIGIALVAAGPAVADGVLSGRVADALDARKPAAGATVSAKAVGGSITVSVFTDQAGEYVFPRLSAGKYRVWAQHTVAQARAEVELGESRRLDLALHADEKGVDSARTMSGDEMLAGLPDDTPNHKRLKRLVRNNCTGCHTPSYVLQHRFDEAGWGAIIELMKRVNVSGIYQGPDARPNGILDVNQKELAAYLARARGPGASEMRMTFRPPVPGEATRAVVTEYDVPIDPELGLSKAISGDGSDWTLGTPSRSGSIVHDAWADWNGNLWYTANTPNHSTTIGKIDGRTGAVKLFKLAGAKGLAANTHGMTRDERGIIWFNVNTGRGGLGRLDPTTEQIEVFTPPEPMSPTGGATTVDYDGKGKIWVSAPDGALRFDPDTRQFTEFKSPSFKTANGTGLTYGVAADRDGNGWWAQMAFDTVVKGEPQNGAVTPIKLPPAAEGLELVGSGTMSRDAERAFYDGFPGYDFNTPALWAQGPRRMGTDKQADVLWVGNSWGGNLARIDTKTNAVTLVPLPDPWSQQPYQVAVDRDHRVWTNLWTTDRVARFDPATSQWTLFDLPTRGSEARYISVDEHGGGLRVVVPYSRTSKVAVITLRSESDLQALKAASAQ